MMTSTFVLDALLCVLLLVLAVLALRARDPFQGVVVFVAFGLLMALGWARLRAPDLALTEAALGAGVTGALFLAALGRLGEMQGAMAARGRKELVVLLAGMVALLGLLYAGLARPRAAGANGPSGLVEAAHAALPRSGVTNPVTAVILNYRAYDTFLELGVLMLVVLGVLALMPRGGRAVRPGGRRDVLLASYARVLIPFLFVMAGYLLWVGASRPGGAFQAGSLLAGAGVLLLLTQPNLHWRRLGTLQRLLLALGFALFGGTGLVVMLSGQAFLEWPVWRAKEVILLLETAATLSIGFTLAALFAACSGRLTLGEARPFRRGEDRP